MNLVYAFSGGPFGIIVIILTYLTAAPLIDVDEPFEDDIVEYVNPDTTFDDPVKEVQTLSSGGTLNGPSNGDAPNNVGNTNFDGSKAADGTGSSSGTGSTGSGFGFVTGSSSGGGSSSNSEGIFQEKSNLEKDNTSTKLVGGKNLQLDKSALLIAGAQTNFAWLIPVLLATGIGLVLARRQ